jgi:hypothetical protein
LPLYGATRDGIAPAKEPVGKRPDRYKPVEPGTVFYNPMRILLGSIAMLDEGEPAGITSPDYVVVRGRPGVLHHRVFYYWLRSSVGEALIRDLARGGVRERILFNRLAEGVIPVLPWKVQERLAEQLGMIPRARAAAQARLAAAEALPAAYLRQVFEGPEASKWGIVRLREMCDLLPSKSISTEGDTVVQAITTACLSERGFLPAGVKTGRMRSGDVADCVVWRGEVLIARSNTPELVGRVAMYNGEPPGVVATDLTIRIWPRETLAPKFLAAFLAYLFQTGYWRSRAGGASGTMKKITREQLLAQELRVPNGGDSGDFHNSLVEQQRITADLCSRMAEAERLSALIEDELVAIKALPAALLREAFGMRDGGEVG